MQSIIKNLKELAIIVFVYLCLPVSSYAAFLGDVQSVRNLPGYIDLSKKSYPYQGIKTSKIRGVAERRTPSQILSTYIKKNKFDLSKFDKMINELKGYRKNIKITYCMDK